MRGSAASSVRTGPKKLVSMTTCIRDTSLQKFLPLGLNELLP
jgi:hypothetical protein